MIGIEGEFVLADLEHRFEPVSSMTEVNWVSLLGARVGYAAGNTLFFAKGGVAWADLDVGGSDLTEQGWFVGGGIEQMLSDTVSVRIDYTHVGLESSTITLVGPDGGSAAFDLDQDIDIVRLGVSFRP